MYARFITFTLGAGMCLTAQKLANRFATILKTRKGLVTAIFFANEAAGEYGVLTLWKSKEDVDEESTLVIPRLQDALANINVAPPTIRLFQVYEPRV